MSSIRLIFLAVTFGVASTTFAADSSRCEAAAPNDREPWRHNARVLSSFPPDDPLPRFLGAFGDSSETYELQLWRNREGVFGELLHPVLDADSPTSRLYQASMNPKSGRVTFVAQFPEAAIRFEGKLTKKAVRGTVTREGRTHAVDLRKLKPAAAHGAPDQSYYRSRAQFNCAMALLHRY